MAFGLLSTNQTTSYQSLNSRRKIFYQFPTGAAPLMGLLSMLPSEDTDKPTFGWWERRFPTLRTTSGATGAAVFANGGGGALTDGGTGVTLTKDTVYRATVLDTSQFKPTHVVQFINVQNQTGSVNPDVTGTVTSIVDATHFEFRPYATYTGVKNGTSDAAPNNYGVGVKIIGTANQEGAKSGQGVIQFPVNPTNLTQIFRTAFSLTRTQLKTGLVFDKSGPYKSMAWENGLRHMVEMEKAFIWGQNETVLVTDAETGDQTPETKTGGAIWFLQQWEAANSLYRGGSGAAAVTSNLDDNKRIIDFAGNSGSLTKNDTSTFPGWNTLVARLFRKTNDKAYEKICLCGGTVLSVINAMFEREITRTTTMVNKERNIEFIVHSVTTIRGTVHFKVHPLFDEDPDFQGSALFLDLGNLKYRYLTDSDTIFLKNRQARDRDSRKDEWISECGLELRFPESCMYWKGLTQVG